MKTFETFLARRCPTLLGLGEPTHWTEAFPLFRNEVFRYLVREHGYRSIALETDCLAGRLVDRYVTTGAGDLDQVLATGFSHGFGAFPSNRALVEWLRDHNTGRAPEDQVRFHGFDAPLEMASAPSPRAVLTELHGFLSAHLDDVPYDVATIERLAGEDAGWADEAAMWDGRKSQGDRPAARELRLIADDLAGQCERARPGLPEGGELLARTAVGLCRYHALMTDTSPERMGRLGAQRDVMMAENLLALPHTFVSAHNQHLQRRAISMMGGQWCSAGAQVAHRLGDRYVFIATDFGSSDAVGEPASGTLQAHLAATVQDRELVETAGIDPDLPARTGDGRAYLPFDAVGAADAIAFLQRV
ncbi:erythromycin esterase family protein [Amycolatopsis jiangsuensis]|uniref:Erythromycin esterase-like protein n=1 Tax=Amycolatopsis jiangsuensis TaxID=1181879 RepID=A0A840J0H7_9PSEU|nr:erythromycin esterase family protein [Amycolatopsis jiangsuensis]MBB4686684.1 erythromycin esterase-like protein [Amycolatopsis jiangsuensis]